MAGYFVLLEEMLVVLLPEPIFCWLGFSPAQPP